MTWGELVLFITAIALMLIGVLLSIIAPPSAWGFLIGTSIVFLISLGFKKWIEFIA